MRGEHLLLPHLIGGRAIGHQLLEGDFAVLVSLEDQGACIGKAQTLAHHKRRDAEGGGDGILAVSLVRHGFEGAEFVEGGERFALRVLGKAVGFGKTVRLDDAGDGCVFGELLLLDEKLECAEAARASLNAVEAGLDCPSAAEDWADA